MTDKEVGELWTSLAGLEWPYVQKLIRKLVEERANYIQQVLESSQNAKDFIPAALRQFGIDPKTWKRETEAQS